MLDTSIFFLIQNLIILLLLFWFLSWLGTKFFKSKDHKSSTEIFECGFLTTHNTSVPFNYNFFLTAVLLILYDVEFFFLLPFLFNFGSGVNLISVAVFVLFIVMIVVSFIYDWESISLSWVF